jgi:hypothetical protein
VSHVLRASSGSVQLGVPATLSAIVHVGLVVLALVAARGSRPRGEVYAVNLIAAPCRGPAAQTRRDEGKRNGTHAAGEAAARGDAHAFTCHPGA